MGPKTEFIEKSLRKPQFKRISPTQKSKKRALEILGDENETGDSDVVALLLDSPHSMVATDDKRLRTVCRALGGKITGTLGILIHAVKMGKLMKSEAFKILKELNQTGFRMSIELYENVKEKINEI